MTSPDPVPPLLSAQAARLAAQTPWKVANEMRRLWILPWARLYFWAVGVSWDSRWRLYGLPIIQKYHPSMLQIGPGAELRSWVRSNPLAPSHPVFLTTRRAGARLVIGADFGMTGGTLCADQSITIGARVTVGANSTVIDTDFHPLNPVRRRTDPADGATAPVVIEDDVFIGMNCLILKGVTLGAGSVIGAGSVVTRDVPPGAVAVGSPARILP